ncbi:AMP-dependent synthetase [Alkalispirochaeta sphaeroplastigenens]|uniref:AMP-dependent synthetase n=1 Tax=Alkalispirochaeta sphaeroplastigenens TaxID=1187066 RepID=A0A2S4K129_9SPIO|nr:AMP-binding protein [Alkalispirochaeta sphaeroplastigenens]POR05465.1 AMP-dependent synthetase [Alkalispirochaeta sphaeroplastigenens]
MAQTTTKSRSLPWDFLDDYRGELFSGRWPTLPQVFEISLRRFPDRPCFTVYEPGRVSLTYREAHERITAVARHLRSLGVRPGDRVAVTGKNSPEWAVAYLGVLFAGAVVVPIDYQLHQEEIATLIRAGGAEVLFVDEERFDFFQAGAVPLKAVLSLARSKEPYLYSLAPPPGREQGQPAGEPVDQEEELPSVPVETPAAILFTSGTTGHPKGVVLSHENLVADCFLAQANLTLYHTDVFYALLPLHHSYCMLAVFIESLSVGAETVFGKRVVISQVLHDLRAAKVTMFLGVPLLFNKLLAGIMRGIREKGPVVYGIIRILMWKSGLVKKITGINLGKRLFSTVLEKASLSTIRICISGGGPLAPSVFRAYNQLGIDFIQGYGLTETSPILTLNPVERYKETSVGKVLPETDIRIIDADERGVGEIVVKGPMVMQGYYEMPRETAQVFTDDGYFRTGDMGYLDDEQYLYLTGRAKNLIVSEGGKNVYPEEIENAFQLYDEIAQILVRGYQSERTPGAELIEALVYPNRDFFAAGAPGGAGPDQEASSREVEARIKAIVDEVNKRLQPYQRISRTQLVEQEMATTSTKKIKRDTVD